MIIVFIFKYFNLLLLEKIKAINIIIVKINPGGFTLNSKGIKLALGIENKRMDSIHNFLSMKYIFEFHHTYYVIFKLINIIYTI